MSTYDQFGIMNPVQQHYSDTCAIKSQQLILGSFGINLTEDELVDISQQNNWYDGNGTSMEDIGKLLELQGIPVTQVENANVYTLVGELAKGHEIIVTVDADELWNKGILTTAKDLLVGETPNHALLVSGIDTTDPDHVKVVVTDPGSGDYCKSYDINDFMDAWKDSNCFMVSTDIPVPLEYNPEMIHFDYAQGHIPEIGTIEYDRFENEMLPMANTLSPHPEVFQHFFDEFSSLQGIDCLQLDPPLEIPHESVSEGHFDIDGGTDNINELNNIFHEV